MKNNQNPFIKHKNILTLFLLLIVKLSIEDLNDDKTLINEYNEDSFKQILTYSIIVNSSITINITNETINTSPGDNVSYGNITEEEYHDKIKRFESKGLSTGGIIGLVVPCAIALIAGIVAAMLCPCTNSQPPLEQKSIIENTANPIIMDSSMVQVQPQIQKVTTPQVVVPAPVEVNQPIYKINKISPPIPRVNRVFEPLYPSQRIVTVNQPAPTSQVIQVKQVVPQISKIAQVKAAPVISQKVYVPEPEPKIISTSQIVSPPKVLPETQTSQVNPSKVLPPKYLPKIKGEAQVLPVKVLPLIDRGTKASSAIETIPYNAQMQITSSQMPLTSQIVNTPISTINEPITSKMNLFSDAPQISEDVKIENIPFTHLIQDSGNIPFKTNIHKINENNSFKAYNAQSMEIDV